MKLIENVDRFIYFAATREDAKQAQEIIDAVQEEWDKGGSFIFNLETLFEDRKEDSEEEVNAAVELLTIKLAFIAIDGAIKKTSREDMVAMLNFMEGMTPAGRMVIYGQELRPGEMLLKWNALHPEEKAIIRIDHFEN